MNEMQSVPKSSRLAPLVLRLGIAAVLAYGGLRHFGVPGLAAPASPTEAASPVTDTPIEDAMPDTALPAVTRGADDEVNLSVKQEDVIAAGQLLAAGALTFGLFTRLFTLAILGFIGAVSYAGLAGAGDNATLEFGAAIFQQHGQALALLAAACVSLLISGCGSLGLDRRRAARKALIKSAKS